MQVGSPSVNDRCPAVTLFRDPAFPFELDQMRFDRPKRQGPERLRGICVGVRDQVPWSRRLAARFEGVKHFAFAHQAMLDVEIENRRGVGDQVSEAILRHSSLSRSEARARTIELFHEVGIPDPEPRLESYPHQLSGGQKQRVMIAMALSCNPRLLIADEPTTALDVTIQAQILDLLRTLRDKRQMSILFITHDLGVIAEIADHVAVMYRGRLVEYGDVISVFSSGGSNVTHSTAPARLTASSIRIGTALFICFSVHSLNAESTLGERKDAKESNAGGFAVVTPPQVRQPYS